MNKTKIQKTQLIATNKLLSLFVSGKIPAEMPVSDRAAAIKITPTQYYVAVKRLKAHGKLKNKDYRRNEPMVVLDPTPLDPDDPAVYKDPYKTKKKRTYKMVNRGKKPPPKPTVIQDGPLPLLTESLDIPVFREPDDNVTLSGPVDAMVRFLSGMKGAS